MLFSKKQLDSEEYKRLSIALLDIERSLSALKVEISRIDTQQKSFSGRFYAHLRYEEEEPLKPESTIDKNGYKYL